MSGRTACRTCGCFHEPHCLSSPINPHLAHAFIALPIDWERERIAAARAAMQGMLACGGRDATRVADLAVDYADKLIAELQKKEIHP